MILKNDDEVIRNQIFSKYLMRVANVPLPANFTRLRRFTTKPKYIIVHDTNCLNHADSALKIESPESSLGSLKINDIAKNGHKDVNFHFIVDRIGKDYEVISGRPMNTHCDHDDISDVYKDSMHVIILFDLNISMPKNRLYSAMANRCLSPLIKMLKIGSDPGSIIKFHDEVLKDDTNNLKCPGDFLARELLIAQTRRYL